MPVRVKTRRGDEMRVRQPELLRLLVHLFHERADAPRNGNSSRIRRVVPRGQEYPVKQVAPRNAVALPEPHGRALNHYCAAVDDELAVEVARFNGKERGHYLSGARHCAPLVRVLFVKHGARFRLDKHCADRRNRRDFRARSHRKNRQQRGAQQN